MISFKLPREKYKGYENYNENNTNASNRNLRFYTELVIVTVLSLVAANAWIYIMRKFLDRYSENNFVIETIVAIVLTLVAVGVLHYFFKSGESFYVDEKERTNGENISSDPPDSLLYYWSGY